MLLEQICYAHQRVAEIVHRWIEMGMNIPGLLTSAGINISICVVLLSLYSVLSKQPSNACVYFGQRLSQVRARRNERFSLERFVPSPSWLVKAWETSEEEIQSVGGLDAVVFIRMISFCMKIFSVAAITCTCLVLPVNYYGKEIVHRSIASDSLDSFTIGNIGEGSKWLWAHCLALYIISFSTCLLLYLEYKSIANMRMAYIIGTSPNPSHFTVLARSIPWSPEESYSESVRRFFMKLYPTSYLSHQMVYDFGTVRKLMNDAATMYKMLKNDPIEHIGSNCLRCGLCRGSKTSFKVLFEPESVRWGRDSVEPDLRDKECPAAFVFFRTRSAALTVSRALQSSNPMLWVTDLAPEPDDVYWRSLQLPFGQLWIRKIATLLATSMILLLFILPVTLVQGLVHLDKLQTSLPLLRGILKNKFVIQIVTGYLPSVVLMLFLYIVPPIMMHLSTLEGPISRSSRKMSACRKILYFLIWNVFFVNVISGKFLDKWGIFNRPKDLPNELARAVPSQATFFTTYVLTSGWASVSSELVQPFALFYNFMSRHVIRSKDDATYGPFAFPYHTEIPRVLVFGLLGFTLCILAPLILPFLLVYFFLAYLVYRNQILNVYVTTYQSGGRFWTIVHNTLIFSLVLTQIITMGVFGIREASIASGLTIPLIILTLLFNEYCRRRFQPIFQKNPAEVLIDLDRQDEQQKRFGEIYLKLQTAYCRFTSSSTFSRDDRLSRSEKSVSHRPDS